MGLIAGIVIAILNSKIYVTNIQSLANSYIEAKHNVTATRIYLNLYPHHKNNSNLFNI
jgi:hypothetical protein